MKVTPIICEISYCVNSVYWLMLTKRNNQTTNSLKLGNLGFPLTEVGMDSCHPPYKGDAQAYWAFLAQNERQLRLDHPEYFGC